MTSQKLKVNPLSEKQWRELLLTRLEEINSPRSLSIYLLMEHCRKTGNYEDDVLLFKTDPHDFNCSTEFFGFYEPTELVRKADFLNLSFTPRDNALKAFNDAEELCYQSNRRIRTKQPSQAVEEIIHSAEKMISSVLGEIDKELLDSLIDLGGWGPGVTSSSKGKWLSEFNKFIAEPQCTPALHGIALHLIGSVPSWSLCNYKVTTIRGSTVTFVPKDAKTDRPIAIEPSINMYLQKAVGKVIRSRLRSWGLDLNHGQSKNKELAYLGSKYGDYVTIDLSSASDTMSIACVERLLPSRWCTLLGFLRSPEYNIDGVWKRFHKWSSMGNGYTFELETLIFAAVVRATRSFVGCKKDWTVYGDDIIASQRCSELITQTLSFLGFSTNVNKTFFTSFFRESCGSDFFDGVEVRPFYLKQIKEHTHFTYANWLLANQSRIPWTGLTYHKIIKMTPRYLRNFIPKGSGVIGFEVDMRQASLFPTYRRKPNGWYIRGLVFVPQRLSRKHIVNEPAAVGSHLRSLTASDSIVTSALSVTARASGRWRVKEVIHYGEWPELPWA